MIHHRRTVNVMLRRARAHSQATQISALSWPGNHVWRTLGSSVCVQTSQSSRTDTAKVRASHQTNGVFHLWSQDCQAAVQSKPRSEGQLVFALDKAFAKFAGQSGPTARDFSGHNNPTCSTSLQQKLNVSEFLTSAYVLQNQRGPLRHSVDRNIRPPASSRPLSCLRPAVCDNFETSVAHPPKRGKSKSRTRA